MKRARTASQSSGDSSASSGSSASSSSDAGTGTAAAAKFKRTDPNPSDAHDHDPSPSSSTSPPLAYTCSLPPGCAERPVKFTNLAALESHYSNHHAYVCSVQECSAIFPSDHFLSLHLAEIHDPIVAVRRDNGQRTYACFIQTCTRMFSTPKKRRLHLTDLHKYPKEYFFALPKYGLQQLYSRFGDSASLVGPARKVDQSAGAEELQMIQTKAKALPNESSLPSPQSERAKEIEETKAPPTEHAKQSDPLDDLAKHMDKISFVPSSVRFGRGRGGRLARSRIGQHQAKATEHEKV